MSRTGKWLAAGVLGFCACSTDVGAAQTEIRHPAIDAPLETGMFEDFGKVLARSGDHLFVGAGLVDLGELEDAGAVYVFERDRLTWRRTARLTSPLPHAFEQFGHSVAADGDSVAVGVWDRGNEPLAEGVPPAGTVYLYRRQGAEWRLASSIAAPAGDTAFGRRVALSDGRLAVASNDAARRATVHVYAADADRYVLVSSLQHAADDSQFGEALAFHRNALLVGSPRTPVAGTADTGAVLVYGREAAGWTQRQAFHPSDTGTVGRFAAFGSRIAISGDTAVVAAMAVDAMDFTQSGEAYVFVRDAARWAQQGAPLLPTVPAEQHGFGHAVAIDGDKVLVGAPFGDGQRVIGRAVAFRRTGTAWRAVGALEAESDANLERSDGFGAAIVAEADLAVLGAPIAPSFLGTPGVGKIHTFQSLLDGDVWVPQHAYHRPDGYVNDAFGHRVVVDGDTALVAAPFQERGEVDVAGRVHVYRRSKAGWAHEAELVGPAVAELGDWFGYSIALRGNTAVVGALHVDAGVKDAGVAYVFVRSGTAWRQEAALVAPDRHEFDNFGNSVAIDGESEDRILIGAWRGDTGITPDTGSAYLFRRLADGWAIDQHLRPLPGAALDFFGYSVALEGQRAFVGAPFDDVEAIADAGTVRVFEPGEDAWEQTAELRPTVRTTGTHFGYALASALDTEAYWLYIGAPGSNADARANVGAVYLARWNELGSSLRALPTPAVYQQGDGYGSALATFDGQLLVGVPFADRLGYGDVGAAHYFDRGGDADGAGLVPHELWDGGKAGSAVALGPRQGSGPSEALVAASGFLRGGPPVDGQRSIGRIDLYGRGDLLSDGFEALLDLAPTSRAR